MLQVSSIYRDVRLSMLFSSYSDSSTIILNDSEPECPSHWDQQRFAGQGRALWHCSLVVSLQHDGRQPPPRPACLRDSFLWMHPRCPAWFKESLLWCKESPLLMHKLRQMEHRAVAQQRTYPISGSHQGAQRQQMVWPSTPSQKQSDALCRHKKFPGLWHVVTVPQHNKWSHLHWVALIICLCIFSLQGKGFADLCNAALQTRSIDFCLVNPHWSKKLHVPKEAFQHRLPVLSPRCWSSKLSATYEMSCTTESKAWSA